MIPILTLLASLPLAGPQSAWTPQDAKRLDAKLKAPARLKPLRLVAPPKAKVTKATKPTPTGEPPASKGLTFVTADPRRYELRDGVFVVVPDEPPDNGDPVAIKAALGDVYAALARGDYAAVRSLVPLVPAWVRTREMRPATFAAIERDYYRIGALAADERGDPADTASWFRSYLATTEAPSVRPQYAAALLRLGSREPALEAYVRRFGVEAGKQAGDAMPPVTDARSLLLRAECYAAWELMAHEDYRLGEIHAKRALALDGRQGLSAFVLVPYYLRKGRFAEAIQVGEAGLPYTRGDTGHILGIMLDEARRLLAAQRSTTPIPARTGG